MNIKLICSSLLAMSIASSGLAGDDDEYMEVTAPNECCLTPLPGGLGMLTGWGGASAATGGAKGGGTLKDVALKAAVGKAVKQKSKAQEKKEEQKNQYDKVTSSEGGALEALINQLGAIFLQLTENGGRETLKYKKGDEELEYEDCVPSGPLNPNKVECTEERMELFTDPTDGVERWAYTVSVVEPKYNPKHLYADANGIYPAVVDNQTLTIVFETREELASSIRKLAAAR